MRTTRPPTPAGTPILANQQIAQVGLLEFDPVTQQTPGYLYHIALYLNGVLASPGSTQFQRDLAIMINSALSNVRLWLGQARHDAAQLLAMDDAQLAQSSAQSIVDDLVTMTANAYQGRLNPTTHRAEDGELQLAVQIQRLANFSVTALQAVAPANARPLVIGSVGWRQPSSPRGG